MSRIIASKRCILKAGAYRALKAGDDKILSISINKGKLRARKMTQLRNGRVGLKQKFK